MIRVICDRCGAVIPASGKVGYLAWNFKHGDDGDFTGDNLLEDQQYCQDCMCRILAFISGPAEKEEVASGGVLPGQVAGGAEGCGCKKVSGAREAAEEDSGKAVPVESTELVTGQDGSRYKAPQKEGKRKRIDIGKVMALRNAKWSIEKIADEMGVAPSSIANAISRYRRNQDEGNTEISGR